MGLSTLTAWAGGVASRPTSSAFGYDGFTPAPPNLALDWPGVVSGAATPRGVGGFLGASWGRGGALRLLETLYR